MKYLSILHYRLRLYVCVFIFLLVGCNSAQETKRTVEVNGESVTQDDIELTVTNLLVNGENNTIRKWQNSSGLLYCGVIALREQELTLFNEIFLSYASVAKLNISECKLSNDNAVSFLFLYLDKSEQLLQIPALRSLYNMKDANYLKQEGVYRIVESKQNDNKIYFARFRSHRILTSDVDLQSSRKAFEEDIIFALFGGRVSLDLNDFDELFKESFLRAYYSYEVFDGMETKLAIPVIAQQIFDELLILQTI